MATSQESFYWHDYETWGVDPHRDRPAQFAGVRTDTRLNIVGESLVCYCRPAMDMLPQPQACLVTGITPQQVLAEGLIEPEFIGRIQAQLGRPGTCGVGYNSIRFDDEVTRFTLYRNFHDPYAREWRNGNSRWDLIDVVRLAHALRPDGIEWPLRDDGVVSFRLEALSAANGIGHEAAHEALSDVHATIGLARLLRERQPRLFEYALTLRDKRVAGRYLNLQRKPVVLHVSARYSASQGCIAPVVPLCRHPVNANGVIVFDLRRDPRELLALDAEAIRQRLFTPLAELPQGQERVPLKTVHLNRCPMLAPLNTLSPTAARRWGIDAGEAQAHADLLRTAVGLEQKLVEVHRPKSPDRPSDPDLDLYGEFFSDADRREIERVRQTPPERLAEGRFVFADARLPELLFRYRARNWPQFLSPEEQERWSAYRHQRLRDKALGASVSLDRYRRQIVELRGQEAGHSRNLELLQRLWEWGGEVAR